MFIIFDFYFDWDKDFYQFTRSIKDMNPYEIIKKDSCSIIVHGAIGICKDDINVTIEKENKKDYLKISGETKNEITGKTYSVNSRFQVDSNEIKNIEWYVKDGLLYVEVYFKKPEQPQIEIKCKH